MAFSLKRIELSNIRSHHSVVFEPAQDGLTSIHGPNGSGKSTLVDSVAWCLYGTKPPGVSKVIAIVREGAELGKDKCFASLDANVDGRSIRIVRKFVNKYGAVECEVFEASDPDLPESDPKKWKNVAGPAVSHAEPYIRKLLRMDEKGFLAAILVQQKQVDQLISATPRERAAVIEKLTGIASVTAAVTESRQEYNSLKKMASFSTVNESELAGLKADLITLHDVLKEKTAEHNRLTADEKTLKKAGHVLAAEVDEASELYEAAQTAQTRLTAIAASVEAKEKELLRVVADKDAKKKRLSHLSSGSSLSDVEEQRRMLRQKLTDLDGKIYAVKADAQNAVEDHKAHQELISIASIKDEETAREKMGDQEHKLEAAHKKRDQLTRERSAIESSMQALSTAISVIRDGHGSCPTCLQKVSDVDSAVTSLEADSAIKQARLDEITEQSEKVVGAIRGTEATIEKFKQLVGALEGAPKALASQEKAMRQLSEHEGGRRVIDKELTAVEKIHAELKAQEDVKNEYSSLLATAQAISSEIESMKAEAVSLREVDVVPPSQQALSRLRKKLEASRSEYLELTTKLTEERGEVRLLRERGENLEEKIASQEETIRKHKELLKAVEISSHSTQLLEEFRSNRIEHSVPLLELYSSDLLNRFTEGKFTRLKIDGKFNASVVLAGGSERAIGLLSGGELSAAAMSLRLAISMMLNEGSSQNLIILDEVLVSQDVARAQLILATIKEVSRGQVILIAHNSFINDVADKLVELV